MQACADTSSSSYGDAFADVYDDWYRDLGDIDATVAFLSEPRRRRIGAGARCRHGPAGGAAATLRRRGDGHRQQPEDARPLGVERPRGHVSSACWATWSTTCPVGPFDLVIAAYNTLFNLLTVERQQACFRAVAAQLADGGSFVVEAFVPQPHTGSQVSVRSLDGRPCRAQRQHPPRRRPARRRAVRRVHRGRRGAAAAVVDPLGRARATGRRWPFSGGLTLHERWAGYDRSTVRLRPASATSASTAHGRRPVGRVRDVKSVTRPYIAHVVRPKV